MTEDEPSSGESNFERRWFLKTLGVGAGVTGFAGLASGASDFEIVESEPLAAERAAREFDVAREYDYYGRVTEFVTRGSLEALPENVWGHRIRTSDEAFDERNPVVLSLPYVGPDGDQVGFYWVVQLADDDGRRRPNGGVGTTVELVDGEYRTRAYGWENEEPAILRSEPVESTPESADRVVVQGWWACRVCRWAVDVICDYGLYTAGEAACDWICWSSTCEQSCDAVVQWLDWWLCSYYSPDDVCGWAGLC